MKLRFDFANQEHELLVEKIAGVYWLHFQGETFTYEPEVKIGSLRKSAVSGEVSAPMPGKITKVYKKNGDAVKAEDTILVMEAMKMEYSLKAGKAGVVREMSGQMGDQVSLGQKLFVVGDK